jgi:DNA-binding protein HU-beta
VSNNSLHCETQFGLVSTFWRNHGSIALKKTYTIINPAMRVDPQITHKLFNIMNKVDLIEAVHATIGGTKVQAEQAVEKFIESIIASLKKGEEVSIAGLGIFSAKERKARTARNPRTGEAIQVPAMRVPKFRAAKGLKDAVK